MYAYMSIDVLNMLYIYIHIYLCVYMHIYINAYIYIYIYTYLFESTKDDHHQLDHHRHKPTR